MLSAGSILHRRVVMPLERGGAAATTEEERDHP